VQFVIDSFDQMGGGELYVPRIPSVKIMDLVEAIAPGSETVEIGVRPGEKLHEEMISQDDSRRTLLLGDRFVVLPTIAEWGFVPPAGEPVADGFAYRSDTNDQWLSVEDLRTMIESFA
jgi:UDP-N-acetylglucosamine 4,6-dehydratase